MNSITSYAGTSGRISINFTAHEALILNQMLEEIYPLVFEFCVEPQQWFREGISAFEGWKGLSENDLFLEFLCLINRLDRFPIIKRTTINPLHINCFYQLLTGNGPINELGESQIYLLNPKSEAIWVPSCYDPENSYPKRIALSKVREAGVNLFDQDSLLEWIKLQ